MHNWINIGHQQQTFHDDVVEDCPMCHATEETWAYLFQCFNDDSITIFTLAITKFMSELITLITALVWNVYGICAKNS
eukprot:6531936-Ditylum_brightwellii.AAC.1